MLKFKLIIVFYLCVNCVHGYYVPSLSDDDAKSNDKKLINDLTIIKNKLLPPNDKGVSGLDEFHTTNNANLLTKGSSSSSFNDRSTRFINLNKLIKFDHDNRNNYDHGRHYTNAHKYCDHRSSSDVSVEDNTSAFNDWVKFYKQFMAQSSTTVPAAIDESITNVKPTITESLPSSMAHDDAYTKIDVRLGEDFDEIELIRLIPSVIDNLKTNRLTHDDRKILSQIYGDLWLVIDEESKRDRNIEKINPILKLILQIKHFRKREIDRREFTDDYHGNTVEQVKNNDRDIVDQPLRIKLGLTEHLEQLSPAQRILRTIVMLINNTGYNYMGAVADKQVRDRESIKMRKLLRKNRVSPHVMRMRRSPLQQNRNNHFGNDIDLYDSDEQMYRRRVSSSFDDNPSIIELIKLAEIHRLRRQQKFNKHSLSLIDRLYAANSNHDNDEYYDDEEVESDNKVAADESVEEDDDEYEEDDSEYDY